VKIGGGTNLHNLDGYLTVMLIFFAYLNFDKFVADGQRPTVNLSYNPLIFLILVIPILFSFGQKPIRVTLDPETIKINLEKIQRFTDFVNQQGDGEILFIAERHLITFGTIQGVQLVPDYEKIVLMEMALGRNQTYLDQFEQDLRSQRFSLIVTDIIARNYKEPGVEPLAEENNVHVDSVVRPLQCFYESVRTLRDIGIEIWMPKSSGLCP
jgi:hypothetical protein